ncbi:MAG: chromosome segregation protein SMC [Candidatus Zipacnadales bacterium]
MHLKKVEISGFKTFADKTELHFTPGITCIVGPNGVGKSNVADAILWGLGEQSRKALRSATSQDVIFVGSHDRPPLSLAEVSLTIDNSSGRLPIDFSEVTVTRRLFRSGETEYFINKSRCRLRDIQELFLDTGLGPSNAYSIVTQGEIDTILSIRPEDRRLMLESVAGIGQYRTRRDESTRKLTATQANITRLTDIIHELSSQRKELERPALLAKEYNALAKELGELELQLLICQHRRRRRRIGGLAHERDLAARDAASIESQLHSVQAEQGRIRTQLRGAENFLSELSERAATALSEAERARGEARLAEERLRSALERRQTWREQLEIASGRCSRFADQANRAKQVLEELRTTTAVCEQELGERQTAYEEQRQRVIAARQAAHTARADLAKIGEDAARLENEVQALQQIEEDTLERQRRLQTQQEALTARAAEITERLTEARRRVAQEEAALQQLTDNSAELRQDLDVVRATLREHAQKLKILEAAAAEADSRCRVLADFEHIYRETEEGVRAALKAHEAGELTGILGVIGDVLNVPARFEAAIEAALGSRLQWILVQTQEDARRAIAFLRERGLGRATFLPLSSLARVPVASVMLGSEGTECLGVASRLVRAPAEFQKAVDYLLRDAYIVKDLDSALKLHRRLVFQARCVTLDGEIVEKCGAVEGGSGGHPGMAGLGRKREVEAAQTYANQLRGALAAMVRVREKFEAAGEQISREFADLDAKAAEARASLAEAKKDVDHLEDHANAAKSALAEIAEELTALEGRLRETRERRAASLARATELRESISEMEEHAADAGPDITRALEEAAEELARLQIEMAGLRERAQAAENELQYAQEQCESAEREMATAREAIEQLDQQIGEFQVEIGKCSAEADRKSEQAAVNAKAADEQRRLVADLRAKLERLDQAAARLTETLESKREIIHRTEVQLGREEAELDHIVNSLQDQFNMTPEQAEASQTEPINEAEVTRRANELRRAIRALGPVNPGADEEYERLKAREEILEEQKRDLEQSREDLLKIIEEIDEETTSVFLDAFQRVSVEFDDLFKRLFGGGETKLTLTQPDNVLETGVDVIVKPPGKKQQHLLLLSGGEKAMTALALLLAMLRVKPTPFCVMDEIDAPLDAMNTGRFVKVLAEFAERSQFILITHNPRTMEAADRLYGVTMEQPGVSTIISVELADAQREAELRRQRRRSRARGAPLEDADQAELELDFSTPPMEDSAINVPD